MSQVFVHGIGAVSPAGWGVTPLRAALDHAQKIPLKELARPGWKHPLLVRQVPASDTVVRYAVRLVNASRPGTPPAPDFINKWVTWGASLRASEFLSFGGKARAILRGRYNVSCEDVRAVAPAV